MAVSLAGDAEDGLAESEPLSRVRLVGVRVVAFGGDAHGQNVVCVPGGFGPGRSQRDMQSDLLFVGEHLDPAESIGVGPHRVVDPREVGVELCPALLEQVGEEDAQLVVCKRILGWPQQFVPAVVGRRHVPMSRLELVPGAW